MWMCDKCSRWNEDDLSVCLDCGTRKEGLPDIEEKLNEESQKGKALITESDIETGDQPMLDSQDIEADANKNVVNIDKRKFMVKVCGAGLFCVVTGSIYYYFTDEKQAIRVVNAFLNSIKTGKGDPYEYINIVHVTSIFINVLDYKYLSTMRKVIKYKGYEFELLYDIILTNRLGQRLYKKYIFIVRPDVLDYRYKIHGYHER